MEDRVEDDVDQVGFEGSFRHVGYVVEDLDDALGHFGRLLGVDSEDVELVPPPDVPTPTRFAFFEVGGCTFELIEPVDDHFVDLLRPDGIRIDHVAFTVADVDAEVARLGTVGVVPGHVTPDGPVTMPRQRMCYLDAASAGGVLLELVQPADGADPSRRW